MCSFASGLLFAACSTDNNIANEQQPLVDVSEHAKISMTIEPFASPKQATRAASEPKTIQLANGMEAEISVEPDDPEDNQAMTRALSNGKYTIYAINKATGLVETGTDKELVGTFNNGFFTHDNDSHMRLAPGTYTFVCYSEGIERSATDLYVGTHFFFKENENDLIGVAPDITISGEQWYVKFVMKHTKARMRFRVTAYTNKSSENCYLSFISYGGLNIPVSNQYKLDGTFMSSSDPALPGYTIGRWQLPATSSTYNKKYVQAHDFLTNYVYLLPNTPLGSMFSTNYGNLYGADITYFLIAGSGLLPLLKRNESCTVNVKITPRPALYLFQDGTCGALAEKGTRTPIGVVVKEKTKTEKGLAMALKPAATGVLPYGVLGTYWLAGDDGSFDNMKGYEYTYTTNYYNPAAFTEHSTPIPTTPPAEQQNLLPPYYYTAHYDPGVIVTGANVGKWFLPSTGQVKLLLKRYAGLKEADMPSGFYDWWNQPPVIPRAPIDYTKFSKVFTDAGGSFHGYLSLSGTDAANHNIGVSISTAGVAWDFESGQLPYMHQQPCQAFVYF